MGEFTVHRVRFFDYMPSAIRAMAFHASSERLAVARADGAVEIFNFADNYFQEKVIPGRDGSAIEALCWAGRRLFSAGLDGQITEYDLEKLRPRYSVEAYGGPVWTLSAGPQGALLAVGCEDGTVKLFEVLQDRIQFQRNLDRQKGRILSVSWHPAGTHIAAGMVDMIRIFDAETGGATRRLQVERGLGAAKSREVVVWTVVFLADGSVISGDSAGKVQVWDSVTGTLVQTHTVTKWDVLTLAVSQEGDSLLAGSSEGLVFQLQLLPPAGRQEQQWVRTRTFRNHSHDVRALVHTATAVVSGGMDSQLVVRPLLDRVEKNTQESALRKIMFPHRRLVRCVKEAGLLLFQFSDHLELWRLGASNAAGKPGEQLPVERKPEKLLQLKRKGVDHICSSAVSPCGGWLVYSTVSSVRLYRLQRDGLSLSIHKVPRPPRQLHSVQQFSFSSDASRLFAASQSSVVVVELKGQEVKYVHTLRPPSGSSQPVHLLSTSEDRKWLAAAATDGQIHVYDLQKLKFHCTLPVYSSCPTAIAIHPTTSCLISVHADQQVLEFSLPRREFTAWSRALQQHGVHPAWRQRDSPVTHVSFSPAAPAHLLLHDAFMFCIIDQNLPLPAAQVNLFNQSTLKNLPAADRLRQSHCFKICKAFQPLLCVELLDERSLVVVERPLLDILSRLPAPVRQKKFAT